MSDKLEIKICLGSSCFSRGNKEIVDFIQNYLSKNDLNDKTDLKGGHCFGDCSNGPKVKINGKVYNNINQDKLLEILEKQFKLIIKN
ncbi:MAG: (2Fe-2S) ferredoxin domain-containing protein [Bacteroidales bacterium]|nr:(2Fe-2S) ferredoxin domain-containing protein [Bacteroidales bacterium]